MAPVTIPFIPFVIIWAFAMIGYIVANDYVWRKVYVYFNKFHAYVIKKGWL